MNGRAAALPVGMRQRGCVVPTAERETFDTPDRCIHTMTREWSSAARPTQNVGAAQIWVSVGRDDVEQMALCSPAFPSQVQIFSRAREQAWLRVLIMTQADDTTAKTAASGSVSKSSARWNAARCFSAEPRSPFRNTFSVKDSVFDITIPVRACLSGCASSHKNVRYWLFEENPDVFFDELPTGTVIAPLRTASVFDHKPSKCRIVQALAHMSGRRQSCAEKQNCKQPQMERSTSLTSGSRQATATSTVEAYGVRNTGKVFCASLRQVISDAQKRQGMGHRQLRPTDPIAKSSPEPFARSGPARRLVQAGDYAAVKLLFGDVPDTLSQLIRTAFVPREGCMFIVSDFSAIEARVIAWLAGEQWRQKVFEAGGDIYCASASAMFHVPVVKHGVNGHLRQKGKIAELALGYGGSVGALKAMGALEMGIPEEELQPLVSMWRSSNLNIVKLWWDVDAAVMEAVEDKSATGTHGISFECTDGMLFLTLPSGRHLSYVKPRIGTNRFGGNAVTYMGIGGTKKWERIESYGPKFCENIVQAISRTFCAMPCRPFDTAGSWPMSMTS